MQLITILGLAAAVASAKPTVYFIRHGEKPESGNGLSGAGLARAQCLRQVFGGTSSYDIQYILAQTPKSDGKRQRPLDTVKPLAADLGLSVDTHCDRDDPKCVKKAVKDYKGDGNILICWEHKALHDLAKELGAKNAPDYPGDRFDQIWIDPSPYNNIDTSTSEQCPGDA
ncbi:hypothetical protein NLG97_g7098 [Lecanicillium saksenae]|uniref:Uncharacterized protein n=1 Tax=Lecanicillium saksenae TaxID=468837 RepID=A0ACC1QP28_9HYPO|nr:hypothetical protein NLG97_g7098 [Lecanicillium saksenae]